MSEPPQPTAAAPPPPTLGHVPELWQPNHGVTTPAGTPIPDGTLFFAAPPEEIGRVLSAACSLRRGGRLDYSVRRLGGAVTFGFVCLFVGGLGAMMLNDNQFPGWLPLLVSFAVGAVLGYIATPEPHRCWYVGEDGFAFLDYGGQERPLGKAHTFRYADAAELERNEVRTLMYFVYTGTNYTFLWKDAAGKKVFDLTGVYWSWKGTPGPADTFHFAVAAARAWLEYRRRHGLAAKVTEPGALPF